MPGSRLVSIGSSASAVPMPIMMASLRARRRWTRSRTASPGNRKWLPTGGARLTIGRDSELEQNVRPPFPHPQNVTGVIAARRLGADTDINRDAGGAQPRMSCTGDLGVWILDRRDHARDAGGDDRVGARRRFAEMRAGFECDVERGALRLGAGTAQSFDLGMRPAARLGPAAADDRAILDQYRADRRIRPGAALSAAPQRQGQGHEMPIVGCCRRCGAVRCTQGRRNAHSAASSPDNSASAASKSLASRKLR